ncbi:MAG: (d)CMP kinase [Christensenellaceae bacterium]|jgi:cytidylate kinase
MKIAIDGPAGAGKSTVAKAVAEKLKLNYLDTGAMYRAAAYHMIGKSVPIENAEAVVAALPGVDMRIVFEGDVQHIFLGEKDVTPYLRTPEVTKGSSDIAVIPEVRLMLVELQRAFAKEHDVVMDGRDIGTYVLPDAEKKFYITASPRVRANRRYLEIVAAGKEADLDQIEQEIIARDKTDSGRKFAPLKQAEDALLVDTSNMAKEEVIDFVIGKIKEN